MKRYSIRLILLLLTLILGFHSLPAQVDSLYLSYIEKYSYLAINEMRYSKIPASITMAQALLESKFGTSELALKANNHFGIKCQNEWSGGRYTYQDDDENTCFRKYTSIEESFRDHSNFLMYRPRYAGLFKLDAADYKAWAHGLKQAGYATNPNYAPMLLRIIADYRLFMLDTMQPQAEPLSSVSDLPIPLSRSESAVAPKKMLRRNRIEFVVAKPGDDIKKLTKRFDKLLWEIRKYNEIPKDQDVRPGQIIYLQPKRRQAEAGYSVHVVEKGETMYSISQLYGIRLKWLYKRNAMKAGSEPEVGEEIWLRGMRSNRH